MLSKKRITAAVLGFDGMRQYNEGIGMCQGVVGPYPFLFHSQICTYTENMKFRVETVLFFRKIPRSFPEKSKRYDFLPGTSSVDIPPSI